MTHIPTMKPLKSSCVEAIGHHGDELHVKFKSGHYVYRGVPAELHARLMASDSVGKFIGQHIRGRFAHHKIETANSPDDRRGEPASGALS